MRSSTFGLLPVWDGVQSFAMHQGVEISLSFQTDGTVWIDHIARRAGPRGAGRKVVDAVCQAADVGGHKVRLVVVRWLGPVKAIYEAAGFAICSDANIGPDDDFIVMERLPTASSGTFSSGRSSSHIAAISGSPLGALSECALPH